MTPRRRNSNTKDFPEGLYTKTLRGEERFYYRYPSGTESYFPMGTKRQDAIEAAAIFNAKHRSYSVATMLEDKDRYNKPLAIWLPKVLERFKAEEKPGESKLDRFMRNYNKLLSDFGNVFSKDFCLEHVNDFLTSYFIGSSAGEYNRALSFLSKVGDYLMDMSATLDNPAKRKKRKPKETKLRKRLAFEDYKIMLDAAKADPDLHYLYIAMSLTLQTTHAVNEITNIKYTDAKWHSQPIIENGLKVFGYLHIHRQKTKEHDESRVKIPITESLKQIIDESRSDRLVCPYVVHRKPEKNTGKVSKGCTHQFQVTNNYLSRAFSALRDRLGLYAQLPPEEKPTYHEMRATAADRYKKMGINPQQRLGDKDEKSTKIYLVGHDEWVVPEAAEIKLY